MKDKFKIATLSDRLSDPITVITSIATVLPSLFPNLVGSERLTMDHLNQLFPGNGFYTVKYKNYLLSKIKYLKDVQRDLHHYTGEFIEQNKSAFCPNYVPGGDGTVCWQGFYKILQKESLTGGMQPVGNVFGSGFDLTTLLLIGGGAVLLLALTKRKGKQ